MKTCIIAAVAANSAIGNGGSLPWNLPGDMRHFRETTEGYPVIMGRKTYESLGSKPLEGRLNIVLTKDADRIEGAFAAADLEDAYGLAWMTGKQKCFIIGGAQLYREAIADADELLITRVALCPQADAFFPEIRGEEWKEVSRSQKQRDGGIEYEFVVYARQ